MVGNALAKTNNYLVHKHHSSNCRTSPLFARICVNRIPEIETFSKHLKCFSFQFQIRKANFGVYMTAHHKPQIKFLSLSVAHFSSSMLAFFLFVVRISDIYWYFLFTNYQLFMSLSYYLAIGYVDSLTVTFILAWKLALQTNVADFLMH